MLALANFDTRIGKRRVRWFFAGLLVVSALLDIVGALLVQHQTRAQFLEGLLPAVVTLGGRTGAVLSGLALLLLARGVARGKRIAFRLTLVVLAASVVLELVKDLDFEAAVLFAWVLFGLWWFRDHFDADSDPARVRWGIAVLVAGLLASVVYALLGAAILEKQLQPEFGVVRTLESLLLALAGNPTRYRALTERADWFLSTLPVISYALIIFAMTQLLRPVLAPRAAAAERERLRRLLQSSGRNSISRLAVHGASSYRWLDDEACVAFTLRRRVALALGDPVTHGLAVETAIRDFVSYCERQDWIPAFYQVDDCAPYRSAGLTLVPVGAEALLRTDCFSLAGSDRADLRYATRRCEKSGVQFVFRNGSAVVTEYFSELQDVSGAWLKTRNSPELGYSLGTMSSLSDDDIVVGMAFSGGHLEAFVSWLPVPARSAWTLDLMRRRPNAAYGVIEALIVHSIAEARCRGIAEVSLGITPRKLGASDTTRTIGGAWRAIYWSLDRFQRSGTLHQFKEKFGPRWEDRYLAVPSMTVLPEVMVALVAAHLPPSSAITSWLRALMSRGIAHTRRPALA